MTIRNSSYHKNSFDSFKIDCGKCHGLCCIALYFTKLDGFPNDKKAGKSCTHLQADYMCGIHNKLEIKGYHGCLHYDCLGAGMLATQLVNESDKNKIHTQIQFDIFEKIYQLQLIRYYLNEVMYLKCIEQQNSQVISLMKENEKLRTLPLETLISTPIESHRKSVNRLLKEVIANMQIMYTKTVHKDKHYLHKKYKNIDFSGTDFTMQMLIASEFTNCCFKGCSFLGSDLRDVAFYDCDLEDALFITQMQVNVTKGNTKTKLPPHLTYPHTYEL